MDINELVLQRGRGISFNAEIVIKHPTLQDICDYSEKYNVDYFGLLSTLLTTSVDFADILWFDNKIWYEDIENEWKFFIQRMLLLSHKEKINYPSDTQIVELEANFLDNRTKKALNFFLGTEGEWIFWDNSINKKIKSKDPEIVIINLKKDNFFLESSTKLTEYNYHILTSYLKKIHWVEEDNSLTKLGGKGKSRYAKEMILRQRYKNRKKKTKPPSITIGSINSSLIAKGVSIDTWNMPIYLFYDVYHRMIKINEYENTISALYAGAIDTKKHPIKWEKINWASVIRK